jgi:hypothetical protein
LIIFSGIKEQQSDNIKNKRFDETLLRMFDETISKSSFDISSKCLHKRMNILFFFKEIMERI